MSRIYCIYIIIISTFSILWKRRKEAKWAETTISKIEQQLGGSLSDSAKSRAIVSYSGFIPMVTDPFLNLHNRYTNNAEKERILLYFICSSLFDDFSDLDQLTNEELYNISFHPEKYSATQQEEKLFLYAHQKLKAAVQDQSEYDKATKRLFTAQLNSVQQKNPAISIQEIKEITLEKGGTATFLCHFYLDEKANDIEQQCWFLLGSVFQVLDDLMDVHQDLQEGSYTMPIKMKYASESEQFFTDQIQRLQSAIDQLPFHWRNKFTLMMSAMAMYSLGKLALYQLKKLEITNTGMPDLKQVPRKYLIIDMEKPMNIWRCIKYIYKDMNIWLKNQKSFT
ncbi:MAG: hypothetical protein IBJ16_06690 [Chitinophagaceae bacterium]|nr:hypothetical protein [Chitinophagaceae bacterium]